MIVSVGPAVQRVVQFPLFTIITVPNLDIDGSIVREANADGRQLQQVCHPIGNRVGKGGSYSRPQRTAVRLVVNDLEGYGI